MSNEAKAPLKAGPGGGLKMTFIVNPGSGPAGRNRRIAPVLEAFIQEHSLDAGVVETEGPGHATVLAREAVWSGCRRVVAVGGDGTINEVAQGLLRSPGALAIVPAGSGNGLARYLGLGRDLRRALELAANPAARLLSLDTGTVNERPFFNAAGAGFDAEVSRRFNQLKHRGLAAYLRTGFGAFLGRRNFSCAVTGPAGRQVLDAMLITAANSDEYGNGAKVAPHARADDGLLDLVVVRPIGFAGAAILAARLFLGSFDRSPRVRRFRGPRFRIERPEPGPIHTDGEVHDEAAELTILVHPRSLHVVAP